MSKKRRTTKKAKSKVADAIWASLHGDKHKSVKSDDQVEKADSDRSSRANRARRARAPRGRNRVIG